MTTMDRTDDIRAALMQARRRAWVAKLDEAIALLWKAESMDPLARAVLEDLRKEMSMGHPW